MCYHDWRDNTEAEDEQKSRPAQTLRTNPEEKSWLGLRPRTWHAGADAAHRSSRVLTTCEEQLVPPHVGCGLRGWGSGPGSATSPEVKDMQNVQDAQDAQVSQIMKDVQDEPEEANGV